MIVTLLMVAAAQAAPAAPEKAKDEKTIVHHFVIRDGKDEAVVRSSEGDREILVIRGDKDRPKFGERREIRIVSGGAPGKHIAVLSDCSKGRKIETEANGTDKDKPAKVRLLVCAKGGEAHPAMTEALERAVRRISEDQEIPAEVRAKVLASIAEEIARLKGGE